MYEIFLPALENPFVYELTGPDTNAHCATL